MNGGLLRIYALLIAVLAAGLVAGCNSESDAEPDVAVPFVEVVEASEGSLPLEERVSGIIRAENQVAIRAEIEAPIVEVLVRNGETVRRGQALVRQDASILRNRVREAEAAASLAEASADEERARVRELEARVERMRALSAQKLVSEQDLETLEAQLAANRAGTAQEQARVEQAKANLEENRRELERAVIRAPISGSVGRRDAEVGMIARPGDVLFVIGNLESLIVEVPLTEEMLGFVKEGQSVRIHSPLLDGGSMEAKLARISPFLESSSFSTVGEIEITNPDRKLHAGMFVEVDLLYGESEKATLVPTSALWEDPKTREMTVWVATDMENDATTSGLERRLVELHGEGQLTVAANSVRPGEWVVVVGQHLLEGDRVDARVRRTTWQRVEYLQRLQREDLLEGYLAKQQELARTIGARPQTNEEFLGSDEPVEADVVTPLGGGS